MTKQHRSLATTLRRLSLATGMKLAICLIAVVAIGYTQVWVESFGGGYGGPIRTQIGNGYTIGGDIGETDLSTTLSNPYPFYPWDATQVKAMVLILALLIGLNLWHTLWAAPRRRERMLAAELRPMQRLVSSTPHQATRKRHKRQPIGAPAWH